MNVGEMWNMIYVFWHETLNQVGNKRQRGQFLHRVPLEKLRILDLLDLRCFADMHTHANVRELLESLFFQTELINSKYGAADGASCQWRFCVLIKVARSFAQMFIHAHYLVPFFFGTIVGKWVVVLIVVGAGISEIASA